MDQFGEGVREVRRVAAALTTIGVRYALGGSMASSLLGTPRFTRDADLTIDPFPGREQALANLFGPEYYLNVATIAEANRSLRSFNIINTTNGFKVDVFVRKDRGFDRSALDRRIEIKLLDAPDEPLYVLAAEDVVLFKLEWYRLGDEISDRQWNDILGLLKVRRDDLDVQYLRHWAGELRVDDLLDRALQEAAEP